MLEKIKKRCGIAQGIAVYDDEIKSLIEDAKEDMKASGVCKKYMNLPDEFSDGALTAITLYVKAYLGNDRTDTDKYLELYRKKVFRMTLEGEYVDA